DAVVGQARGIHDSPHESLARELDGLGDLPPARRAVRRRRQRVPVGPFGVVGDAYPARSVVKVLGVGQHIQRAAVMTVNAYAGVAARERVHRAAAQVQVLVGGVD